MNSSVACVIVNYNDWLRTLNLVKVIIQYKSLNHVIVVNNCSSDDSAIHLSEYENEKYIYIEAEKNGGYGYGNNIGIRKAAELKDGYVLISNPDVFFSEKCLEDMIDKIKKDNKCAIINAVETYMGISAWKYTSTLNDILSTSIILNRLLKSRYYNKEKFQTSGTTEVDIIQGSFLLISVDLMLKYGMYDEEFFLYEEEKVLYSKFKNHGFHFLTDLDVSFEHRHIEHSGQSVKQYINGKKRLLVSKELFLKKYRKVCGIKLIMCKIFFKITLIEMFIYANLILCIKKIKSL